MIVAASRMRHPLEARTLARLAAHHAGDGRAGGRLRPVQRRAPRRDVGVRAGVPRSPGRRAWRRCRTAASCWDPRTSRTWSAICAPTGSGTGCVPRRTPGARAGGRRGCRARGVPCVERVARRVRLRCRRPAPRTDRRGRRGGPRCRRPAPVPLPAGGPVRDRARRARVLRRRAGGPGARVRPGQPRGGRRAGAAAVPGWTTGWPLDTGRTNDCINPLSIDTWRLRWPLALVRARRSPRRDLGWSLRPTRDGRAGRTVARRGSPPSGTPVASPRPPGPRSSRCRCSSSPGRQRHAERAVPRVFFAALPAVAGIAYLAVHAGGELTWPRPDGAVGVRRWSVVASAT